MPIETAAQRVVRLREVRERIITGGEAVETEEEFGNGVRRRVKFNQANLERLDRLIEEVEREAAVEAGGATRTRRRALIGGGRRRMFL